MKLILSDNHEKSIGKGLIILMCLFFYLVKDCVAQNKSTHSTNFSSLLEAFNRSHYQEAISLHINSSFLLVGESLLFKAYSFNSFDGKLSDLSKIIYIELIDENLTPALQTKISVKGGQGFGDLFLPSSLISGNYTLIAYTNWMRNFPQENFFRTQLTIINPFKKPINQLLRKNESELEQAVDKGIAIRVNESESKFDILLSKSSMDEINSATILVTQRSNTIAETRIEFKDKKAEFEIKKETLPFGDLDIAVISDAKQVMCERSLFNPIENDPGFGLSLENKNFKRRENVQIKLEMKDTFSLNLSMSVRKIEKKIDDLIFTSSTTDLPTTSQSEAINKDLRILTTKNSYTLEKKIINGDSIPINYLPEVRGNLLSGSVMKNNQSAPATGKMVYLSLPAKEYYFAVATTDSTGRFYFNTDKIKSNAEVIIQTDSRTCPDCKVTVDHFGLEDYSTFKPRELDIDSTFRKLIEQRSLVAQIENAYYEQKQDSIIDPPMAVRFYGKPDNTYRLDDYVRFPSMEDIFIEYVFEVILKKKNSGYEIKVMDLRKRQHFETGPLILIDGIPIFDNTQVMNYNPFLVEKIEIVGRRYFLGALETQGIISLTTYEGTGKNLGSLRKEKYLGIQPQKKYFSPKYSGKLSALDRVPDYRIQLYWNPSIIVSKKSVSVDFFSSDLSGDFEIVAEGIRNDGRPVYYREVIHIE